MLKEAKDARLTIFVLLNPAVLLGLLPLHTHGCLFAEPTYFTSSVCMISEITEDMSVLFYL